MTTTVTLEEIKHGLESLKIVLVLCGGLGMFVGAMVGGIILTRKLGKQLVSVIGPISTELTDKQNGSFRGEFHRFQERYDNNNGRIFDILANADRARVLMAEQLGRVENKTSQLDTRLLTIELSRAGDQQEIKSKFVDLEEKYELLCDNIESLPCQSVPGHVCGSECAEGCTKGKH